MFTLEVITPFSSFNWKISALKLITSFGELTIMENHASLIAYFAPQIIFFSNKDDAPFFFNLKLKLEKGFLFVGRKKTRIFTNFPIKEF